MALVPTYNANFHTQSYRSSRPANAIRFGAVSDAAAAAVAAELANWTLGRLTSLQKKIYFENTLPYDEGSRLSVAALGQSSTFSVYKVRWRNLLDTVTEADITNLLMGTVGSSGISAGFTALSTAPNIPNGSAFASVSAITITNKY